MGYSSMRMFMKDSLCFWKITTFTSKIWEAWGFPLNYSGMGSSAPMKEPLWKLPELQKAESATAMTAVS